MRSCAVVWGRDVPRDTGQLPPHKTDRPASVTRLVETTQHNMDNFYINLNDGTKMPRLGLGTWKSPPEQTKQAIITAVKAGYRTIDCANDYDNEHVIGEALKELFAEGVVKREDLFIQAKLWNGNHRPEHVKPDIMKTLEDLQLDYIDSFVIHWPQAVPSTGNNTRGLLLYSYYY